jgi:hypothetical protein
VTEARRFPPPWSSKEITKMSPRTHYWIIHWLRVVLWPLPVLTFFRAGRAAVNVTRRR